MKRVLRYLHGIVNFGIWYEPENADVRAVLDADFAADTIDRKSMSGFFVKLNNSLCVWGKRQNTVVLSTCDAEYHTGTLIAKEVVWMHCVLCKWGPIIGRATAIFSDNQSAIAGEMEGQCLSGRAKHIDVRIHFVRELAREGKISVQTVKLGENDAGMLTKPSGCGALNNAMRRLGLKDLPEEEC